MHNPDNGTLNNLRSHPITGKDQPVSDFMKAKANQANHFGNQFSSMQLEINTNTLITMQVN